VQWWSAGSAGAGAILADPARFVWHGRGYVYTYSEGRILVVVLEAQLESSAGVFAHAPQEGASRESAIVVCIPEAQVGHAEAGGGDQCGKGGEGGLRGDAASLDLSEKHAEQHDRRYGDRDDQYTCADAVMANSRSMAPPADRRQDMPVRAARGGI